MLVKKSANDILIFVYKDMLEAPQHWDDDINGKLVIGWRAPKPTYPIDDIMVGDFVYQLEKLREGVEHLRELAVENPHKLFEFLSGRLHWTEI